MTHTPLAASDGDRMTPAERPAGPRHRGAWAAALASAVLNLLALEVNRLYFLVYSDIAHRANSLVPRLDDEVVWRAVRRVLLELHVAAFAFPVLAGAFAIGALRGRWRWAGIPLLALSVVLLLGGLVMVVANP
jgi:hypothetical protein